MKRISPFVALAIFAFELSVRGQTPTTTQNVPIICHYDLNITLQPLESSYRAEARIELVNLTMQPIAQVPVLLYRLVRVTKAVDPNGKPLQFRQELAAMSDEPEWQVNSVLVRLSTPLAPNHTAEVTLYYGGSIWGYREVMRYVQDQIGEGYALLRAETMAYPIVAQASTPGWISAQREPFTYRVRTTVPNGWIVACGDSHRSKTVSGEQTIFECDSDVPREHIEVAAAKFRVIEDAAAGLRIYALPQDAQAAQRVLGDLKRARIFFGNYFRRPATGGYTVIEIPQGWGSQASAGYCIQTPDAFRDPAEIAQLYHELAHSWNAEAQGKIQRARYFDEAFASYFAALAIRQFSGADAFTSEMERLRLRFITLAKRDKRYAAVPIRNWGESELGDGSYTKGAWSLYVLNRLLGDDGFRNAISDFVKSYSSKPADFSLFQQQLERSTDHTLNRFFARWIYGSDSSEELIQGKSIEDMVAAAK
jgi:hypothetical protein